MKEFEGHIQKLRSSGLRPTKQRIMLSKLLFDKNRTFHFTIEDLHRIFKKTFNSKISLGTIYNTVGTFKKKGYLKEIPLVGNKTYYDTNTSDHHHFYDENTDSLIDIKSKEILINQLPKTPNNKTIKSIEVVIRIANDNYNQ